METEQDDRRFRSRIYVEAKALFRPEEIETLIGQDGGPRVRVVHRPTGRVEECADFSTQLENFAIAAVRLRAGLE